VAFHANIEGASLHLHTSSVHQFRLRRGEGRGEGRVQKVEIRTQRGVKVDTEGGIRTVGESWLDVYSGGILAHRVEVDDYV
jgi:hypothetical protein